MAIERAVYRKTSVRNGPTVVPLELDAGLIEGATPALAYRIALGDAQCPGRHWEQQIRACRREPPSRSTLERIAKRIGTGIREHSTPILEKVRKAETLGQKTWAISVGLDRTTIPMEEPLPRGDIRDPSLPQRKKRYIRRPPSPVEVKYRMGYVGTVSAYDADGDCIRTFKYACSADQDPSLEVEKIVADVAELCLQRMAYSGSSPSIAIVQDGAPEMWRLVEDGFQLHLPDAVYDKAIDRYHLDERLADSLRLLRLPQDQREKLLSDWQRFLNEDDDGIEKVEAKLTKTTRKHKDKRISAHDRSLLESHRAYIRNNKMLMRYAPLRRKGLPVGSGATEGACKSTIMTRTKACGQRWHTPGVNSVLALRSLWLSDRLEPTWRTYTSVRQPVLEAA